MYYNFLNLPVTINDSEAIVRYTYLADGTKFTVGDYDCTGYAYRGSLVYNQMFNEIGDLESAAFGSGRIKHTTSGQQIGYHLTDHLGSVRAIVADNSGVVSERNDYHAFGAAWEDAQKPQSSNRYKFSGKELSLDGMVPYLDFGARFYDPQSLLWLGPDPLAEKYYPVTPYAYCAGNPVNLVDPDGRKIVDANRKVLYKNGKWTDAAKNTDAMRVGTAMMKTNIGRNTWNEMSDAKHDITIEVSSEIDPKHLGEASVSRDENGTIIRAEIIIYEGSIDEQVKPQYTSEKADQLRPMTAEDRIGTLGVHEGTHSVDKTIDKAKRETKAKNAQTRHARELERKEPVVKSAEPITFTVKPFTL